MDRPIKGRLRVPLSLLPRFAIASLIVFVVLGLALAYFLGQTVQQTALDGTVKTAHDTLYAQLIFGIVRSGSITIRDQQRAVRRYTGELESSYHQTMASLAAAVDARDMSTERHSVRVTELALALGRRLGLSVEELDELERGAMLHDVGKIGISDRILLKPEGLTVEEWVEMRKHPLIGHRMLQGISFLRRSLDVVRYHHERWDGDGYPERLRGDEIPLVARVFAVVDAYDAITADRPYRRGSSHQVAMRRIVQGAGTQFDPQMVAAFEEMMRHQRGEDLPFPQLAAAG